MTYYVARIQQWKRYVKLRCFDRHFPDDEVIAEIDNPNSIYAFNRFEEKGHAERKYNHFRLTDLIRQELFDMRVPILDDEEERNFLCLMTRYKSVFDQKRITDKDAFGHAIFL